MGSRGCNAGSGVRSESGHTFDWIKVAAGGEARVFDRLAFDGGGSGVWAVSWSRCRSKAGKGYFECIIKFV